MEGKSILIGLIAGCCAMYYLSKDKECTVLNVPTRTVYRSVPNDITYVPAPSVVQRPIYNTTTTTILPPPVLPVRSDWRLCPPVAVPGPCPPPRFRPCYPGRGYFDCPPPPPRNRCFDDRPVPLFPRPGRCRW